MDRHRGRQRETDTGTERQIDIGADIKTDIGTERLIDIGTDSPCQKGNILNLFDLLFSKKK